jgi:hypothetical protein
MNCDTCERRDKQYKRRCLVFKQRWPGCWAWTDDPLWHKKVREAVDKYQKFKRGFITQYWG